MVSISSFTNLFSSLLFLTSVHLFVWIYSSKIDMSTVREAWFEVNLKSGWIVWLLCSNDSGLRNMRLITEFESCWLLEYLVEICSVGLDSSKQKESVISKRTELCWEWWEKLESQILSLMLKSPIMMSMLLMLILVVRHIEFGPKFLLILFYSFLSSFSLSFF